MAAAGSASKRRRRTAVGSISGGDPYPLYPSFDRNTVPWHTAVGGWGAQVALQAPALPTTTRSVTVNNTTDFNTEAAVAGTQITIGTSFSSTSVVNVTASDIDIVVPSGIVMGTIEWGTFPRTTAIARVRVRGSTPGSFSGGRIGQVVIIPSTEGIYTDVVVDGIDLNGDSGKGSGWFHQPFRVDAVRIAVLNCRVISAGYTWLGDDASHVFIANSNFYHGGATRAEAGFAEGWGFRNKAGPVTIVDSRIQGTRYHNLRPQSYDRAGEVFYARNCVFVAQAEGRTAWLWNNVSETSGYGQGAVIENCNIYTYSTASCGFGPEISSANVDWSRVANNNFYGGGVAVFSSVSANGGGTEGNTFNSLTAFPAWGGPGDPTAVPLPSGLTLITGEGVCTTGP